MFVETPTPNLVGTLEATFMIELLNSSLVYKLFFSPRLVLLLSNNGFLAKLHLEKKHQGVIVALASSSLKKLWYCFIIVIIEAISFKHGQLVEYQKGNPYNRGR